MLRDASVATVGGGLRLRGAVKVAPPSGSSHPFEHRSPAPVTMGKKKVEKVLHEFKEGTLESGSGHKVTNRKQAVAIALSEARKVGAKIPKR